MLTFSEEMARQELYHMGYTDKQIAKAFHVSDRAITTWRKYRGLVGNGGSGHGGARPGSGRKKKVM